MVLPLTAICLTKNVGAKTNENLSFYSELSTICSVLCWCIPNYNAQQWLVVSDFLRCRLVVALSIETFFENQMILMFNRLLKYQIPLATNC
jgi:hypothetical protein